MKTTWGCWYKCNFCYTWRVTDGAPYSRSPESIAAELETIDAEDVYIVDDIFLINPTRLARLAALNAGLRGIGAIGPAYWPDWAAPHLTTDGTHPSAGGAVWMASAITRAMGVP